MKFNVALIQFAATRDKQQNLVNAALKIQQAAIKGANLVVLPECFQSPYSIDSFKEYAETSNGPTQQLLSSAAKEHSIYLIGGSIPEIENDKIYNTCFVYGPKGNLIATHRKLHLFDIDVPGKISFQESLVLSPGSSLNYFDTPWGRIGLGICYDVRFPELAIILARKYGVLGLVYPGAFNMTTGPLHWELLLRARALDNQIFVAGCAPARDVNASYVAWGHSTSINPMGVVLDSLKEKEGILMTIWDSKEVLESRTSIPTNDQRRFDVYPDICREFDDSKPTKKIKTISVTDGYFQILEILASRFPKKKDLVDLTVKLNQLSTNLIGRKPCFVTLNELKLIMDWKLQRGKFRPQLKSLIASNSSENVESVTRDAFTKAWPENLKTLVSLKGVGPATATAILSLIDPSIPFFSDEVAKSILKLEKLKYSEKEAISYVDLVRSKVQLMKNITCREYEIKMFTEYYEKN